MKPESGWLDALPTHRLLAELSLWSADLARLADELARMDGWADIYHIDVADGHFSPGLLFFPDLVSTVRKHTSRPLHVHLMVADTVLLQQVEQFAEAGADLISVHAENHEAARALTLIDKLGTKAGLVLQLSTPVAAARAYLDRVHALTLLGTKIGIKGQGLDPAAEGRLSEARTLLAKLPSSQRILLAADGGIREHTVPGLRRAGAQTIVMGSLAFSAVDLRERMAWVRGL